MLLFSLKNRQIMNEIGLWLSNNVHRALTF